MPEVLVEESSRSSGFGVSSVRSEIEVRVGAREARRESLEWCVCE